MALTSLSRATSKSMTGSLELVEIKEISCSIGSLGKGGAMDTVEEVHVRNCSFTGTMVIRIPIQILRSYDFTIYLSTIDPNRDLTILDPILRSDPINTPNDSTYDPDFNNLDWNYVWSKDQKLAGNEALKTMEGLVMPDIPLSKTLHSSQQQILSSLTSSITEAVQVSDVTYDGFYGTSITDNAVKLSCSETVGCTDIVLSNIALTSQLSKLCPFLFMLECSRNIYCNQSSSRLFITLGSSFIHFWFFHVAIVSLWTFLRHCTTVINVSGKYCQYYHFRLLEQL
ncbi:hypothetical protein HYC85_028529 [Camellia sinensis]|uniref:Uncharacterized protein n=1 Tax=Camellia sinensis TaxID=4442 RepID=A0A7J7FXM2_CAMSI|nr:hypothetical protein HYC85_028529 [Camellia sinensis]